MKLGKQIRRVDVQVSILMIIVTIFCSSCIYLVCYRMTHRDMINSLEERVFAIYDFLEDSLDKSMFEEINTREDMGKTSYREMKRLLKQVKSATNMMYLYTAKKNEEGQFIYVIDGLDDGAEDFRYPGDLIEPEIVPDMQRALDGERVLPKNIKDTEWGKIFITYFPVHDGEKVVGVLGIEIGGSTSTIPTRAFCECFRASCCWSACCPRRWPWWPSAGFPTPPTRIYTTRTS